MKRILALSVSLLFCLASYSQTFFDVPVNGSSSDMAKKLESKGFVKVGPYKESLVIKGPYNGRQTDIILCTYDGRVNRVCVNYLTGLTEDQVRKEYNALVEGFKKDPKYKEREPQILISDTLAITETIVNKAKYQATFYEEPAFDPKYQQIVSKVKKLASKPAAKQKQEDKVKAIALVAQLPGMEEFRKNIEDMKDSDVDSVFAQGLEMMDAKLSGMVWLKMRVSGGEYGLTVFYDNPINMPPAE